MAAHSMYPGFLILVAIILVSSEEVYVKSGENITDCSMKCSPIEKFLQLYREDKCLLELRCEDLSLNKPDPRLHLNTSSGCWTLTDAQKNDSGVYIIRRHYSKGKPSTTLLNITVLDPGPFPGKITAPSPGKITAPSPGKITAPSPGEITAPSPGEITAHVAVAVAVGIILSLVIFLSVKLMRRRTMDVERNENNGLSEDLGLTSSSSETDPHREETGGNNNLLLTWIHKIWRRLWKNPEYDQTPQRDEAEMETSH